jgi:hypothetical protein
LFRRRITATVGLELGLMRFGNRDALGARLRIDS